MTHQPENDVWVPTASGGRLSLLSPDPAVICVEDVAIQLARQPRFNGAIPLSVAQHCVLVARECQKNTLAQLMGLLHDGAEYVLGDLARPIKDCLRQMSGGGTSHYDLLESRIQRAVEEALLPASYFGQRHHVREEVKRADDRVLATERRDFVACQEPWDRPLPEPLAKRIELWGPARASSEFLALYDELLEEVVGDVPPAA